MKFKPMLLRLFIGSQPLSVGWRITWGVGAILEFWSIISPSMHFRSSAASMCSLLGVTTLLPNSPPRAICQSRTHVLYPQGGCKAGEEEILMATPKENPLQLQASYSLWGCVCTIWHRTALENKPDRAGFAQTTSHVVSCCYFTLLRYSSGKSSAYANITQICILLCLFFFFLGSVVLGRSFRVRN